MPLYEYPQPMDRQSRQLKAIQDLDEHRKMQKNMYKNLILAAIIITIGIFANPLIIKVILWLIGVGNIITAILLYNVSALSRDAKIYTKIYDDRLEHCQGNPLNKSHTYITFYYEDAVESFQDSNGNLIVKLKDNYRTEAYLENEKEKKELFLKDNLLKLKFQDTKAKLFLINNLYEQIKYPHKEYNIIEDEEDEDDKWDPLHKHGL